MRQTNEEKEYIIYMYIFPNGKRYIGKTSQTLRKRQGTKNEWNNYEECSAVFNAINKYKPENIKQEILAKGIMTKQQSSEIEKYYIALYKTNCNRYRNPEYGYNLTDGGEDGSGPRLNMRGENNHLAKRVYCIETDTYYGSVVTASEETGFRYAGICNCCKGNCYVTHHSDDYNIVSHWLFADEVNKENIQRALKGAPPKSTEREVYCVEIDKYFRNSMVVERELSIDALTVRECCNGVYSCTGRYSANQDILHWLWADEVTEENIQKALDYKVIPSHTREVYCIETNMYFDTEKEGAEYGGVDNIRYSLNHRGYAAGKHPETDESLHWLFAEDVSEENILETLFIAEHLTEDSIKRMKESIGNSRQGEGNARAKFSENDVKVIIQRLLNGEKVSKIAKDYDDRIYAIYDIKNHRAWTYLTKDIVFT